MELLIVIEVGTQKNYLTRSFLFLRAVFYSSNSPKQKRKKLSKKDIGNWHMKNWKFCLLKQQIFRCLHNPCRLSKEGWGKNCLCSDLTHLERACCSNYLLNLYWKKTSQIFCCIFFFCFSYKNEKRRTKFEIQNKY